MTLGFAADCAGFVGGVWVGQRRRDNCARRKPGREVEPRGNGPLGLLLTIAEKGGRDELAGGLTGENLKDGTVTKIDFAAGVTPSSVSQAGERPA